MLSKKNRLSKKNIEFVIRKGRQLNNPNLNIKAIDNSIEKNRYSVIISKRILKKAVERNKLKRQVYEIIKNLPSLKTVKSNGTDISIFVKKDFIAKNYKEKQIIVSELIKTVQFIKPSI